MEYSLLILIALITISVGMMTSIKITAWNMRSLGGAQWYISKLARNSDIIVLSEHRLYNCQLHKLGEYLPGYCVSAKASIDLKDEDAMSKPGHCGVLIAWRDMYNSLVKVVPTKSDRICAVEMHIDGSTLYVIGVYLPHQSCTITSYEHHLAEVEVLISRCSQIGECLVIGDFNCRFGAENGPRFEGSASKNGASMLRMIERQGLVIFDGEELCKGPTYTFNVEGVGQSYIDHCIGTVGLRNSIARCEIMEEEAENTSDHLPITVHVNVDLIPSGAIIKHKGRIKWSKMSQDEIRAQYTEVLTDQLVTEFGDDLNITNAQNAVPIVAKCIIKSSSKLPKSKYSKGLKPYWSPHLKMLHKQQNTWREEWIKDGKPRAGNLFKSYKDSKRLFRAELRRAAKDYERKQMKDLAQNQEVDYVAFWRMVNRARKKQAKVCPIDLGDKIITDPKEICEEWGKYYEKLYTPLQNSEFDDNFKAFVDCEVERYFEESYTRENNILKEEIRIGEVEDVCRGLKNHKAPGWDEITGEHLKFGGDKLMKVLACIYNHLIKSEDIPDHFNKGVMIPIPKGNKDQTKQDNNRGITLLPVMGKVYEKLLFLRYEPWARDKGIIIDIQGANQRNCSSTHTAFLLRETIAHNQEQGNTVYVGLLDTAKAFDTVWINGMLYQLYNTGIDGKLWRILKGFYEHFKCTIRIGPHFSRWFRALQGVHQGALWSMHMYEVMHNDSLKMLQSCGKGCRIDEITVCAPAFADDIAISALYKPSLQKMFDMAYQYSRKWRFNFNASKTVVVVFGKDTSPTIPLTIGDKAVKVAPSDVHMGVVLTPSDAERSAHMKDKVQVAKRDLHAILSLGTLRCPVTTKTASHLYWSVCIPRLCHGAEVACLDEESLKDIEQYHGYAAKQIQGLPTQTANGAVLAPLGWLCLRSHVDLMMMTFLWKMLCLPVSCIYKQITLHRLWHHLFNPDQQHYGPLWHMLAAFERYGLLDLVRSAVTSGEPQPLSIVKPVLRDQVKKVELDRFSATMMLYKRLPVFKQCITSIDMWPWWCYIHYCCPQDQKLGRLLARILFHETCLLGDCDRFSHTGNLCKLCNMYVKEDITHLLFDCPYFEISRFLLWQIVLVNAPDAMSNELNRMDSRTRCEFLLSGFRCKFTCEWKELYEAAIRFITCIYQSRQRIEVM